MRLSEITVLVIDEHRDIRCLLSSGLDTIPPLHVVASTGSPLEGELLAARWQPDVILVDLKMRGRYRTEVCQGIGRASPRSRVIVYTSYLTEGEEKESLESGVVRCLLKGMPLRSLAAEIVKSAEEDPATPHSNRRWN